MIPAGFHKKIQKAGCVFLGAVLLLFAFIPAAGAQTAAPALETLIETAFSARRGHVTSGARLLSDPVFLEKHCGTGTGDWAAFAMARYGTALNNGALRMYNEDYAAYAASLEEKLSAFYESAGVKAGTKLTEYFRMGLALTALGGNAEEYVKAATVYNPTPLARMAILTLDYALIALNMREVTVDAPQTHTEEEYIRRILELRLEDGGWSLNPMLGGGADVDVTAMTLSALAPYYRAGREDVTQAAEEALALLSQRQRVQGDFASYGSFNAESTAQVITALTNMGIDPLTDARFIKNGSTALDGLLQYRLSDGSFAHSFIADPDNPAAEPGNYNYLATDQSAYALVALWRQQNGLNPLYDLREDPHPDLGALAQRILAALRTLFRRLLAAFSLRADAAVPAETLRGYAREIVDYKKTSLGKTAEEPLFSGEFLKSAGSTAGDWYPIGMAALGMEDDYAAYLAALRENVRQRYETPEKLSANKATEWHRVLLAALSCGAEPAPFTVTRQGEPVDLLSDGVFYRKNIARQGINGCIWALIALHARPFAAPADALNTEESLVKTLLEKELPGGGWNMRGSAPDTDITAMALVALAPLRETDPFVREAVGRAVQILSAAQTGTGGFTEEQIENCESSAVVITALCALGIDPEADPRFIKNGNTPLDALLAYRLPNGSFTHAFLEDPADPEAVPQQPNDMSCQQALYALAAVLRLRENGGCIFDYSGAALSAEGYNALPAPPGAAEQAVKTVGERFAAFFADEGRRKTAVSAALLFCVAALAAAFAVRRVKKRRAAQNA